MNIRILAQQGCAPRRYARYKDTPVSYYTFMAGDTRRMLRRASIAARLPVVAARYAMPQSLRYCAVSASVVMMADRKYGDTSLPRCHTTVVQHTGTK